MADHDLDAERAILGAALLEPERFGEIAGLAPSDFYRAVHRYVFEAMLVLHIAGTDIDYKAVHDTLQAAGRLDDVTPVYLVGLVDGVPRAVNLQYHADTIGQLARVREYAAAMRATANAVEAHGATAEILAPLKAALAIEAPVAPTMAHERRVAAEVEKERARRVARRRVDAEDLGAPEVPAFETLDVVLARPVPVARDRIAGWQPRGSNIVIASPYKGGKTSLVDNLTRSVVDGDPFLGRYTACAVAGTLVRLDVEMGPRQGAAWLRRQGIRRQRHVVPVWLRGRAAAFNILDPAVRAAWAVRLQDVQAEILVVDCLRPILDALGLDEHRDAGRFLVALDALGDAAGLSEIVLVVHMGHTGERARGDSRIQDWPDATWRLVRQDEAPSSPRYLSAFGRDVEQPEQRLEFDTETRRLTTVGGSRRDTRTEAVLADVLAVLGATTDAMSGRAIKTALADSDHPRDAIDVALRLGVQTGQLAQTTGARHAKLYRPGSGSVSECPPVSDQCPADGVSASVRVSDRLYRGGHSGRSTAIQDGSECPEDDEVPRGSF